MLHLVSRRFNIDLRFRAHACDKTHILFIYVKSESPLNISDVLVFTVNTFISMFFQFRNVGFEEKTAKIFLKEELNVMCGKTFKNDTNFITSVCTRRLQKIFPANNIFIALFYWYCERRYCTER